MSRWQSRAGAAAVGLLVDRAVGEPPVSLHPVAGFGHTMTRIEDRWWRDSYRRGAAYAAVGVGVGAVTGWFVRSTTASVALAVAGRELRRVASRVTDHLDTNDLAAARQSLRSLVGRDTETLDASGIAAAVIESLAENSVDAVVAPVFWALIAGAPGALAYRAVNTMDAMVGHHSPRHEHFGWAAARLDDVANFVPARIFAVSVALAAPTRTRSIFHAVRRDAPAHPSPNAGVAEAAVAGALGIELGGPLAYGERRQERPRLGSGPRPQPSDVLAARQLVDRTERLLVVALILVALCSWPARRAG